MPLTTASLEVRLLLSRHRILRLGSYPRLLAGFHLPVVHHIDFPLDFQLSSHLQQRQRLEIAYGLGIGKFLAGGIHLSVGLAVEVVLYVRAWNL